MHLEVLVEDSSGKLLLEHLIPRILGAQGDPHTWRVIAYKGVGRIPPNLHKTADPSKRILLDQLPRLLRGYGQTPGVDAVVVVLDSDTRNCVDFLLAGPGRVSSSMSGQTGSGPGWMSKPTYPRASGSCVKVY